MDWIINWRRLALMATAVLLVLLALLSVAYALNGLHTQAQRNKTALVALCAQRHDLDLRIRSEQKILDDTRGKKLVFAIPRSLIVSGFHRDQTTRTNLEVLDCKGGSP
jgi:hypothetical protein